MFTRRDKYRKSRGVVTIEAALVFPILLLLTFGMIEYGWLFLRMETMTNASRRGARVAAMPDATSGEVNAVIDDIMDASGINVTNYQVTISPSDISSLNPGDPITVNVTVPDYDSISLTGSPLLPVPQQIQAEMTIAKEGPP